MPDRTHTSSPYCCYGEHYEPTDSAEVFAWAAIREEPRDLTDDEVTAHEILDAVHYAKQAADDDSCRGEFWGTIGARAVVAALAKSAPDNDTREETALPARLSAALAAADDALSRWPYDGDPSARAHRQTLRNLAAEIKPSAPAPIVDAGDRFPPAGTRSASKYSRREAAPDRNLADHVAALEAAKTPPRCPECLGENGNHNRLHERYPAGGGGVNRPCPLDTRSAEADK